MLGLQELVGMLGNLEPDEYERVLNQAAAFRLSKFVTFIKRGVYVYKDSNATDYFICENIIEQVPSSHLVRVE